MNGEIMKTGHEMPDLGRLLNGEMLTPALFRSPPAEFGIFPFWFVNGEMEYAEMEYQLREFKAKGMPGIFFHARFGIKDYMPYLGPDWFDRVRFTIEKAREIGLQVWIYDEYNWPSGTADQKIQKDRPELTSRYLELSVNDNAGQFFTFMEGTDSRYNDLEQSEPVYACAILQKDFDAGIPNFINLMPSLAFDKVITWETPPGPWKMFFFMERQASWYTDVLNEETTREFLERCHERYLDQVGGDFAGNIKGFYTDEPAMFYFESGRNNYILPWTAKAFKIFRDQNGYELKPNLPKLFFDLGEDYGQVRFDFYNALSRQYEKAYYKQIGDWCEKNKVVFTGHLLYEESLRKHVRTGGNLFSALSHLDMTGVDHLYPRIGTRDMPDEHVALKLASSAAHQNGSARLLCESMGGAYWDVTMERMKWIADWEYVLGVNLLNPHGFHYSIEGERKRDWPPSQFYHHTWWRHYPHFNQYLTRLSYLLSGGRHACPVAILYPVTSIWANYVPQHANAVSNLIEQDFNFLTDRLLRMHIEFDYLDEDVLFERAEVKDGTIRIQDEIYTCLILPPLTHIKARSWALIEQFVAGGGTVIGDTLLPAADVTASNPDLADDVGRLFGVDPIGLRADFDHQIDVLPTVDMRRSGQGQAILIRGRGLSAGGSGDAATDDMTVLRQAIQTAVAPLLEIDDTEVFSLHRVKDGKDLFFIINPTDTRRTMTVTIKRCCQPEIYDLLTGEIHAAVSYRLTSDQVSLDIDLAPYGSTLLSTLPIENEQQETHVEQADFVVTGIEHGKILGYGLSQQAQAQVWQDAQVRTMNGAACSPSPDCPVYDLNEAWNFSTDRANVLLSGQFKFKLLGRPGSYDIQSVTPLLQQDCDDSGWLNFTMGAWEMQLPQERDEDEYPVDLLYRASFTADYLPNDLEILIDGFKGTDWRLYVNGMLYTDSLSRSWLDAEIKAGSLDHYVQTGRNVLAIIITVTKKTQGLLDLIKICGSFALALPSSAPSASDHQQDALSPNVTAPYHLVKPVTTVDTGLWNRNGYPYFSGTGIFRRTVSLPESLSGKAVMLEADCGRDVLEVRVNGLDAGLCLWRPSQVDISRLIRPGENEIEIMVTNTLINVLEAVEQDSGLHSARIVTYNRFELDTLAEED